VTPQVSVIIITWNALPLLQRCFPSVAASTYPRLEIIVADNASTDGSVTWIRQHFPEVRIVQHPRNWFFSRGNNEAIRKARGEFVILLNNDVEVSAGWIEPLVDALVATPDVGAAQPKMLQYHERTQFEYAGAAGGFIDQYGYPFTRGRIFDVLEADAGQYDDRRDVFWASGAAMALRREALSASGLLDEQFEMHMEEIDLCWRLHRNGYRVQIVPESQVYHLGGSSLPKGAARKTYYNFRNNLLMLYKNLSPQQWRRTFPRRALLDAMAALRSIARGEGATAGAVLRAYSDAHRMRRVYKHQRPPDGTPLPRHIYRGSIAAEHYLRGVRRFSELDEGRFT